MLRREGASSAVCPSCGIASHSRHSRYWRQLRDLPLQATAVTVQLRLGRWRCRNRQCGRQIFTERVAGVLAPYARQTNRLGETTTMVGRALGGRPGQRLLSRLGMSVSRHTVIRRVKTAARYSASPHRIRVVGVDDWAWSKGQSFGTILVDLERRQVADVLPTRSAGALSAVAGTTSGGDHCEPRSPRCLRRGSQPRRTASRASSRSLSFDAEPDASGRTRTALQRRHLRIPSSTPALPPSPITDPPYQPGRSESLPSS